MRSVLTLPQDTKGLLALEEVMWFEGKAASKVQGQWSAPLASANTAQQTGGGRKSQCRHLLSAFHKLVLFSYL